MLFGDVRADRGVNVKRRRKSLLRDDRASLRWTDCE